MGQKGKSLRSNKWGCDRGVECGIGAAYRGGEKTGGYLNWRGIVLGVDRAYEIHRTQR
jgi:hypothetical protein